jgi:hypothetical protein
MIDNRELERWLEMMESAEFAGAGGPRTGWIIVGQKKVFKNKARAEQWGRKHGLTHVRARFWVEDIAANEQRRQSNREQYQGSHRPLDFLKKDISRSLEVQNVTAGIKDTVPTGTFWAKEPEQDTTAIDQLLSCVFIKKGF